MCLFLGRKMCSGLQEQKKKQEKRMKKKYTSIYSIYKYSRICIDSKKMKCRQYL